MIDRKARNHVVEVIESFMNDQVTSSDLDDLMDEYDQCEDKTVQFVCTELWHFSDDSQYHKIITNRDGWNGLNRLLLLLKSDAELSETHDACRWSIRRKLATCLLIGCIVTMVMVMVGWSVNLLYVCLSFSFATALLLYCWDSNKERRECNVEDDKIATTLFPFNHFSELSKVRRSVVGFNKKQYPTHIESRRYHSSSGIVLVFISTYSIIGAVVFIPLILLILSLPTSKTGTRVDIEDIMVPGSRG